jgi:hypothetical protein
MRRTAGFATVARAVSMRLQPEADCPERNGEC